MKYPLSLLCCLILCFSVTTPAAASTVESLQKQINELQLQLKLLSSSSSTTAASTVTTANPLITSFNDGKKGKPKITLSAPTRKKSTFNKSVPSDPIVIKWTAFNVPEKTNVTIDMTNVKISGPIGGSASQFALPAGDSRGEYRLGIYGEGRASAGTYRIQLGLEECSSKGCTYNAHFPGQEEDVTLYAQSKSVGVTITGKAAKATPTKSALISTIDDSNTPNPTVTGTAVAGVTSVGFSIGQGDKIYGSGPIPVTNGRWSHTITEDLRDGRYTISLYVNNVLAEEQKFTIK